MAVGFSGVCSVSAVIVVLVSCCRLCYRQYYGQQDCEMTYMYRWPQYQNVPLPQEAAVQFPQYGLYLYHERSGVQGDLSAPLQGIPAIFLPGNAGSHRQARSSASIALRMHPSDFKSKRHFDFFTIDFNEELSGMFGGLLETQTDYVVKCINHILALYKGAKPRPHSVVIIGHSMGGVVARALFAHPEFNHSSVNTIVALSSPLLRPVLSFDALMQQYYDRIEEVWSNPSEAMSAVTLVSIAGGERDVMVPAHLSLLPMATISLATPAVPRNWASADHLAVVWCRRVQLAVTRSLFLLQDSHGGRGLSSDSALRHRTLHHMLTHGKELPALPDPTPNMQLTRVKRKGVWFGNESEAYEEGYVKGRTHLALPLPTQHAHLLAASNTLMVSWVWLCSVSQSHSDPLTCGDVSSLCSLLPPKHGTLKVAMLSTDSLRTHMPNATHLLLSSPSSSHAHTTTGEKVFVRVQNCDPSTHTLHLPWLRTSVQFPPGHCSLLNLSLPQLTKVWTAYQVEVRCERGGVAGGLVVPWYPHTSLSNSTRSPLLLPLSLLAPPPPHQTTPPHLLLWSSSQCELKLTVTFDLLGLLDKLAVVHAPLLLPWVMARCVSGSGPRWLAVELLVLAVLQLASGWVSWLSDWRELGGLWGGCGPVLLHLLSHGLERVLYAGVGVAVWASRLLGGWRRGCGWLLMGAGVLCLGLCSGLALLLALLALLLQARDHPQLKEIACVIISLQLLTLPSLFTWARALRYTFVLSPDPHWVAVMATVLLLSCILFSTPQPQRKLGVRGEGGKAGAHHPPLAVSLLKSGLGVAVLCSCVLHTYRMALLVIPYLLVMATFPHH